MSLEQNPEQHYREVPDKFVDPSASFTMKTYDQVVRPAITANIIITLPPVAEAKGRWYTIVLRSTANGATVRVNDQDDSECWPGDFFLDTVCDRAVLYSDGLTWFVWIAALNAAS